MTKEKPGREKFSFGIPKDLKRPRGGGHALQAATDALGPFQYENRLDALENDCVRTREGERVVICYNEAQRLVKNIASIYLEAKILYERAPRIQEHIQKLEAVNQSLEKVIHCVTLLDDFNVFEIHGTFFLEQAIAGFDVHHELPLPSSCNNDSGALIERLKSFQILVSATLVRAKDTFSRGTRGGRMNVLTPLGQNPRELLATEAIFIFETFTDKVARSHQDSAFSLFVNAVHEYATGIDAEESGMRHAVAIAVRNELERREYLANIDSKIKTLEALPQLEDREELMSSLRAQKYDFAFSPRSLTYSS